MLTAILSDIHANRSSALRRHLGSVSAKVVAEAPCSVSVVRVKSALASTPEDVGRGELLP
jgi:nucleotide-binding universal stress UspA family protein